MSRSFSLSAQTFNMSLEFVQKRGNEILQGGWHLCDTPLKMGKFQLATSQVDDDLAFFCGFRPEDDGTKFLKAFPHPAVRFIQSLLLAIGKDFGKAGECQVKFICAT